MLNGAGVVIGGAIDASMKLAEHLDAPVCCGYQHNDAFPGSHPLFAGPLGYNGSKAGMELIAKADVVLALGTRLNPFSTLPGYGVDYWPKNAKIIQVDINPDRIGLTKPVTVGIVGDAKKVATSILSKLGPKAGDTGRAARKELIAKTKSAWAQELTSLDHEDDDPGTTWNERARGREPEENVPPHGLARDPVSALPKGRHHLVRHLATTAPSATPIPTFDEGRKYLAPGSVRPVRIWPAVNHGRQRLAGQMSLSSALPVMVLLAFQ